MWGYRQEEKEEREVCVVSPFKGTGYLQVGVMHFVRSSGVSPVHMDADRDGLGRLNLANGLLQWQGHTVKNKSHRFSKTSPQWNIA